MNIKKQAEQHAATVKRTTPKQRCQDLEASARQDLAKAATLAAKDEARKKRETARLKVKDAKGREKIQKEYAAEVKRINDTIGPCDGTPSKRKGPKKTAKAGTTDRLLAGIERATGVKVAKSPAKKSAKKKAAKKSGKKKASKKSASKKSGKRGGKKKSGKRGGKKSGKRSSSKRTEALPKRIANIKISEAAIRRGAAREYAEHRHALGVGQRARELAREIAIDHLKQDPHYYKA